MYKKDYIVNRIDPISENCSGRQNLSINMLTFHYTKGLDVESTIRWAKNPAARSSAHFYVGRDGRICQAIPLFMRAWHHGRSVVEYNKYLVLTNRTDRCSIGIEIANCGNMTKVSESEYYFTFGENPRLYPIDKYGLPVKRTHRFYNMKSVEYYWEPYSEVIYQAVLKLTCDLVKDFGIPLSRLVGHEDVALPLGKRKLDPGPMWNWNRFIFDICNRLGMKIPNNVWKYHRTLNYG